jgi:hypothetical protein
LHSKTFTTRGVVRFFVLLFLDGTHGSWNFFFESGFHGCLHVDNRIFHGWCFLQIWLLSDNLCVPTICSSRICSRMAFTCSTSIGSAFRWYYRRFFMFQTFVQHQIIQRFAVTFTYGYVRSLPFFWRLIQRFADIINLNFITLSP